MEIRAYCVYKEEEILPLYASVGWTAYTAQPDTLRRGFENSLVTLAAYEGEKLLGILRAVGDGQTIVYVQDLLVYPAFQRRGIGTQLMRELLGRYPHVRQIHLMTDNTEKTLAFYRKLGFRDAAELNCCALVK